MRQAKGEQERHDRDDQRQIGEPGGSGVMNGVTALSIRKMAARRARSAAPFDGWDIPPGVPAIAEVYRALWSRSFGKGGAPATSTMPIALPPGCRALTR